MLVGEIPDPALGNFVAPSLLADVTHEMLISQEETFGPVAPVLRFTSEEEVRACANASEMGLAAYVYTRDLNRAMRLSDTLEYGMVGYQHRIVYRCAHSVWRLETVGAGARGLAPRPAGIHGTQICVLRRSGRVRK